MGFVFTAQEIHNYLCDEVENFHEEKSERKNSLQIVPLDPPKYEIQSDNRCKSKGLNEEYHEVPLYYGRVGAGRTFF